MSNILIGIVICILITQTLQYLILYKQADKIAKLDNNQGDEQ